MTSRTPEIGTQQKVRFGPNSEIVQELFYFRPEHEGTLVRITADGENVVFDLNWGTGETFEIDTVLPPLSADFPGGCEISVRKVDLSLEASAKVSAAHVEAKGLQVVRKFIDASGDPQDAGIGARWIINPGGAAVTYERPDGTTTTIPDNVATNGRRWPIHSGSVISAGVAYVEYET